MLGEEKNRLNVNQNLFSKNLSFLHLNIRSITNKIDSFSNFLERLKIKFPRLGLMTLFIVLTFPVTIFFINIALTVEAEALPCTLLTI